MTSFRTKRRSYSIVRLRRWGFKVIRAGRSKPFTWAIDLGPIHILATARRSRTKTATGSRRW